MKGELHRYAYVDDSEDVLESHVGEEHEYGSVDVHNTILVKVLPEVDHPDQNRHHLREESHSRKIKNHIA